MTDPRPTPGRAPEDPAPLLGPGQWHRDAPRLSVRLRPRARRSHHGWERSLGNSRGLARTGGIAREYALMDTIAGAIDARACATERLYVLDRGWKRSPAGLFHHELRLRRASNADQLAQWGSARALEQAPTQAVKRYQCAGKGRPCDAALQDPRPHHVRQRYGGRAELADAARSIAEDGGRAPEPARESPDAVAPLTPHVRIG